MLITLIQKEMLHHILSVRFVVMLLMCLLLVPLTLFINHQNYRQNLVDYQESIKRANVEAEENPPDAQNPNVEVSKLFLKPSPLSVFANGLEAALPTYLGMSRNGVKQGSVSLAQAPLSYALGHLDFLFVVSTIFSLLALLFTFDAVTGEKEAGTLRITLANALPRDVYLWSKLIGGYLIFVVPFLVSFLLGLLMLAAQGFPLGEPDIFPRVLYLLLVALLYIAVFFAIGTVISTYLDNSKTALIVAFTVWVLVVLITPRLGFLTAKLIVPTATEQSVYMQKTALRNNLNVEMQNKINQKMAETFTPNKPINITGMQGELKAMRAPIEEEYRLRFQDEAGKIDREYQRQQNRQEGMGEILSRTSPTSSLIYLIMNLTQTGKVKRDTYFQTGDRYHTQIDETYFSTISDDQLARLFRLSENISKKQDQDTEKIPPPPNLTESSLTETWSKSGLDVLLLCFFAIAFTTGAFLKFFRSEI